MESIEMNDLDGPECIDCGQPLEPHAWERGCIRCPQCDALEEEFRRLLETELVEESLLEQRTQIHD